MKYRSPVFSSKAETERAFADGSPYEVSEAIVAAALSGEEQEWAERWIIRLAEHADASTRCAAAVSLGHLARLHGEVSAPALEAVRTLLADEATAGAAGNALDDITLFCGRDAG